MNTNDDFFNDLQNNAYVFSYGGSGTNYLLKILTKNQDNEEIKEYLTEDEKKIKNENYFNLINIIHNFQPQNINKNNFIGIFIFSNPILSTYSVFRRKLPNVIDLLSKKNIINTVFNNIEAEIDSHSIFKNQSPQRSIRQVLEKYNYDFLNLNEHFNNWINAKVNYPIIYINYDLIDKNKLQEIFILLKNRYNVHYNQNEIDNFKSRNHIILDDNIYKKLEKIYQPLIDKINSLPIYWIKNPIK